MDWNERYAATPEYSRSKQQWQVEHQSHSHAPKTPYKLVVHLCYRNLRHESFRLAQESNGGAANGSEKNDDEPPTTGFLSHQVEEIAYVGCIKIRKCSLSSLPLLRSQLTGLCVYVRRGRTRNDLFYSRRVLDRVETVARWRHPYLLLETERIVRSSQSNTTRCRHAESLETRSRARVSHSRSFVV